jgi:hypothetical protein
VRSSIAVDASTRRVVLLPSARIEQIAPNAPDALSRESKPKQDGNAGLTFCFVTSAPCRQRELVLSTEAVENFWIRRA